MKDDKQNMINFLIRYESMIKCRMIKIMSYENTIKGNDKLPVFLSISIFKYD